MRKPVIFTLGVITGIAIGIYLVVRDPMTGAQIIMGAAVTVGFLGLLTARNIDNHK